MKNKKDIILSLAVCVIAVAYILFNTFKISLGEKDIMHFMGTTIIVPAVVLIGYGIIMGRNKTLVQMLPAMGITILTVFAASCFSMFYMYHTGAVFDMLNNTATSGDVVLNINDSITLGTIVQQALIFLVCALLGSGIGNKSAAVLNKIKN